MTGQTTTLETYEKPSIVICAICGNPMVEDGFQEFRRRTEWYKCTSCTHEQVHPMPDMTGYYESHAYRKETHTDKREAPTHTNIHEESQRAIGWFEYIQAPIKRYVDVGSSSGEAMRTIQKEFDIPFIMGVEPGPWGKDYMSVGSVEELFGKYDLVTCFHVVEHLEDPIAFLRKIKRIVSGQVCIEMPRYPGNRLWPHLHQFTQESLFLAMDKAGMPAQLCDANYNIKVKHIVVNDD